MSNPEDDLLLTFEKKVLQREFRTYFSTKRENFHTTMRNFPKVWDCFSLLDQIWCREFQDTQRLRDQSQIVPAMLFRDAHARFRVSVELAFSCCLNEAVNALRFAIEAVYHACKLLKDPNTIETAKIWLESANDDVASRRAFGQFFDEAKRESFEECNLADLYKYWRSFSSLSHSNMKGMAVRLRSPSSDSLEIHYFQTDGQTIVGSIFWILCASSEMERAFFDRFKSRLLLDTVLGGMRMRLGRDKEVVRRAIIKRFNWQPPNQDDSES